MFMLDKDVITYTYHSVSLWKQSSMLFNSFFVLEQILILDVFVFINIQ